MANQHWPSTSIFYGPSGVGKYLVAKAVAQNLICTTQSSCGHCGACQRVAEEASESLLTLQPRGEQVKVDQAREVVRFMYLRNWGAARVVIIDEAHRMNAEAANVLLKTLEEPPEKSYLILVIPTLLSFSPTIRSRSQVVRFSSLKPGDMAHIVDAPPWLLSVGRVDLAHKIMGLSPETLRDLTDGIWSLLLNGNVGKAFQKIKDHNKNSDELPLIFWLWLQMLKSAWTYKWEKQAISFACEGYGREVVERLSKLDEEQLSGLALGVVQLEREIAQRLESSLCFETYFYKADDWIQGRGGELL